MRSPEPRRRRGCTWSRGSRLPRSWTLWPQLSPYLTAEMASPVVDPRATTTGACLRRRCPQVTPVGPSPPRLAPISKAETVFPTWADLLGPRRRGCRRDPLRAVVLLVEPPRPRVPEVASPVPGGVGGSPRWIPLRLVRRRASATCAGSRCLPRTPPSSRRSRCRHRGCRNRPSRCRPRRPAGAGPGRRFLLRRRCDSASLGAHPRSPLVLCLDANDNCRLPIAEPTRPDVSLPSSDQPLDVEEDVDSAQLLEGG